MEELWFYEYVFDCLVVIGSWDVFSYFELGVVLLGVESIEFDCG